MKRSILSGIIVVVVVACLVVATHQVRAQEKPIATEAPMIVKVAEVVPTGISAGKVYLTGSATLVEGRADVKFSENLSEFIKKNDLGIKILLTPVGSWSGIYVMSIDKDGFTVKSATGDQNAIFNWILVKETDKISKTESKNNKTESKNKK